jgi:hypothetical protein
MAAKRKYIVLRVLVSFMVVFFLAAGCGLLWLSHNYKRLILERAPGIIAKGSDSVYHLSIQDVDIHFWAGTATVTGLNIWPDKEQVKTLRARKHRVPPTLSTVTLPKVEISGICWTDLITSKSFDCSHVVVHHIKWTLEATPHPEDSLFPERPKRSGMIRRITALHGDVLEPEITYKYNGAATRFTAMLKGGNGVLNEFVYDYDDTKDTSNFLYANNGYVKPDSFIFLKQGSRYSVEHPGLDFETSPSSITLKFVKIMHLIDVNESSGNIQELYNLSFPKIEIISTNWNALINDGILSAKEINAPKAMIDIHYISANTTAHSKMGDYPNQQLHQVGLKTNIKKFNILDGLFRYTEPNEKSQQEAIIELEGLNCSITNITNLDSVIRKNNNCAIKLDARYNHKSPVSGTINLTIGDTKGHFTLNGYLENLDAADITKQTQALALVEVTSLHLSKIELSQEGDETYVKGNMTMLYSDLKISLMKFKSNMRKSEHGPLSFLANTLLLYRQNPMPGKDVRKVSTTFARDSTKGFISMIWENVLRGAKKTAIRSDALINITDGPETQKGEKPKKGFFKRLFGKKK